jgi:hypothetical protein
MDMIAGLPYYPVEFTKQGTVFNDHQSAVILDAVTQDGANQITDLFIVSHGWNNNLAEARALYEELFSNLVHLLKGPRAEAAANRRFAILGVLWPSKKFTDAELIPASGVASMGAASSDRRRVPSQLVIEKLESLKGSFDHPDAEALDKAKTLVGKLEDSPTARREFVDLIRSVLPTPRDPLDDASSLFFKKTGDELLTALQAPVRQEGVNAAGHGRTATIDSSDPSGGAAGLGDIFSGMKAAAWRLLNYATYYQMKERAGTVGIGLNELLGRLRRARTDLRLHLIGHSFGARVVAAAADGPVPIAPSSMSLLQAAFSHNGFTEHFDGRNNGFFRKILAQKKVNGPIVITHTANDRAVGVAYPLASRISGDNRTGLGDENDVFGGLGRNGAVRMKPDEFVKASLLPDTERYQLSRGKVYNLRADQFISSHGDVANSAVANAVLAAAGI